jgi:hypothetical protein
VAQQKENELRHVINEGNDAGGFGVTAIVPSLSMYVGKQIEGRQFAGGGLPSNSFTDASSRPPLDD